VIEQNQPKVEDEPKAAPKGGKSYGVGETIEFEL